MQRIGVDRDRAKTNCQGDSRCRQEKGHPLRLHLYSSSARWSGLSRTFVVELCEQQRVLEKIPVFTLTVLQKGADQLLIAAGRAHHVVSCGELDFPAPWTCSVIAGHPSRRRPEFEAGFYQR